MKNIIGSTRSLTGYGSRTRTRKRTGDAYYGPNSNIHHSNNINSHALASLHRSRVDPEEQKYHVQIHGNHPSLSEGSEEGGSQENLAAGAGSRAMSPRRMNMNINPVGRIIQTTEVIVHSEDGSGSDHGVMAIGPRRTVEDRI